MDEQIDCGCGLGDACPLGTTLAAAPTPVERPTDPCHRCNWTRRAHVGGICPGTKEKFEEYPAAPAESHGVERAQPVEPETAAAMTEAKHTTEVFQTHNPRNPQPDPYWDGKCSCGATWRTIQPVYQCPAEHRSHFDGGK